MTHKPYLLTAEHTLRLAVQTYTMEEALAYARSYVDNELAAWAELEIKHDDGRRWYWEMQGRHGVIKVDNPPKAN